MTTTTPNPFDDLPNAADNSTPEVVAMAAAAIAQSIEAIEEQEKRSKAEAELKKHFGKRWRN